MIKIPAIKLKTSRFLSPITLYLYCKITKLINKSNKIIIIDLLGYVLQFLLII